MLYVFNTWVIANLIHPIFLYLLLGSMNGEFFHDAPLEFYFLGVIYSFIFSIPVLILAWLLFYVIKKIQTTVVSKFITWIFLATALPFIIWISLFFISGESEFQSEEFNLILPSSIAATFSILIRTKQFFKLFNY